MKRTELHTELQGLADSLDDAVTPLMAVNQLAQLIVQLADSPLEFDEDVDQPVKWSEPKLGHTKSLPGGVPEGAAVIEDLTQAEARQKAVQANVIAGLVIDVLTPRHGYVNLSDRYGIADAIWEAGYRNPLDSPITAEDFDYKRQAFEAQTALNSLIEARTRDAELITQLQELVASREKSLRDLLEIALAVCEPDLTARVQGERMLGLRTLARALKPMLEKGGE